jgi:BASS family bile acid:Na+ symporter
MKTGRLVLADRAALSPVPPILPGKQLRFGGRANYVYGLLLAAALSASYLRL